MEKAWKNPPLFYTLAQIKFNNIANMEAYIPQLQDKLRHIGYPDFQIEKKVEVNIRDAGGSQPDVHPRPFIRWHFLNIDRTEAYTLLPDAIAFHTAQYMRFQDFSRKVHDGISLANEIIKFAYIDRIGLRYLDAIVPANEDIIDAYLNPSLLGLSADNSLKLAHNYNETVSQIDGGTLVSRVIITEHGLALSPDLLPMILTLPDRINNPSGKMALIDTDYFVENRINFDLNSVKEQLSASHEKTKKIFESSVTEYAISVWE
ncbi:MAG: TIGR04255 family protein [Gammaproteobacteria bacterium]|nr:TIGR04255 family protein [Gammaproteobacteria bacterium]